MIESQAISIMQEIKNKISFCMILNILSLFGSNQAPVVTVRCLPDDILTEIFQKSLEESIYKKYTAQRYTLSLVQMAFFLQNHIPANLYLSKGWAKKIRNLINTKFSTLICKINFSYQRSFYCEATPPLKDTILNDILLSEPLKIKFFQAVNTLNEGEKKRFYSNHFLHNRSLNDSNIFYVAENTPLNESLYVAENTPLNESLKKLSCCTAETMPQLLVNAFELFMKFYTTRNHNPAQDDYFSRQNNRCNQRTSIISIKLPITLIKVFSEDKKFRLFYLLYLYSVPNFTKISFNWKMLGEEIQDFKNWNLILQSLAEKEFNIKRPKKAFSFNNLMQFYFQKEFISNEFTCDTHGFFQSHTESINQRVDNAWKKLPDNINNYSLFFNNILQFLTKAEEFCLAATAQPFLVSLLDPNKMTRFFTSTNDQRCNLETMFSDNQDHLRERLLQTEIEILKSQLQDLMKKHDSDLGTLRQELTKKNELFIQEQKKFIELTKKTQAKDTELQNLKKQLASEKSKCNSTINQLQAKIALLKKISCGLGMLIGLFIITKALQYNRFAIL